MICLSELFRSEDIRTINLVVFQNPKSDHLRLGPDRLSSASQVQQNIRNVPGRKIRRILAAVPAFGTDQLRQCWSATMAYGAGTHVFPDANHRTWMAAFATAARNLGVDVGLEPAHARDMVVDSKALRDPFKRETGKYWTIAELQDPEHVYRRLFADYEAQLLIEHLPPR